MITRGVGQVRFRGTQLYIAGCTDTVGSDYNQNSLKAGLVPLLHGYEKMDIKNHLLLWIW